MFYVVFGLTYSVVYFINVSFSGSITSAGEVKAVLSAIDYT